MAKDGQCYPKKMAGCQQYRTQNFIPKNVKVYMLAQLPSEDFFGSHSQHTTFSTYHLCFISYPCVQFHYAFGNIFAFSYTSSSAHTRARLCERNYGERQMDRWIRPSLVLLSTKCQTLPQTAGWDALNQDLGFVSPDAFGTTNISCHRSATPGKLYVTANAGDTMTLYWNTWPDSHKRPILNYIAPCNGT